LNTADILKHTVVILSALGVLVLTLMVSYVFKRRASSSTLRVSSGVLLLVSAMAGIMGVLAAVQSWSAHRQLEITGQDVHKSSPPQTIVPMPPPQVKPETTFVQKLCSADPVSGEPYARMVRFAPRDFPLRSQQQGQDVSEHSGGTKDSGQLQEWTYTVDMPGLVTVVTAHPTGGLITIDFCNASGNRITCKGKMSGETNNPVILNVQWLQPCVKSSSQ
jgi:uncharacterized membrane protein YsdA (DUF1294 family)